MQQKVTVKEQGEAKRKEILAFIESYTVEHCYPPSMREISEACHLKSLQGVHNHVSKMLELGILETDHPYGKRALRVPGYKIVKIDN